MSFRFRSNIQNLTTNRSSLSLSLNHIIAFILSMVDHCYTDLGCFPVGPEFYHPRHRPFNAKPWHRSLINTRFELYNREHPEGFFLDPWDTQNLLVSGFNPRLETKILIPGWLDSIKRTAWIRKAKDAFLWLWHPVNIIVVYWRNFTPYTMATANSRVVGAELANLIKWIEHELQYDRTYYHLIGHSLGAHISGYCGDRIPGLGRITALDPARPFFQGMPKSVRLDRADAHFVDAIHSDFTPENAILLLMSFGMTTPVGHLDFYPNGPPLFQAGCLRDTIFSVRDGIRRGLELNSLPTAFLESMRYLTACDHQRSHEWFVESLLNRQCLFIGVRCPDFDGLINGRCTCDDSASACAIMGIHADQMYLHGVHDELWPARLKLQKLNDLNNQHSSASKDFLYGQMKSYASDIRSKRTTNNQFPWLRSAPHKPNLIHSSQAPTIQDIITHELIGSSSFDPPFVRYLLSNFAIETKPTTGRQPNNQRNSHNDNEYQTTRRTSYQQLDPVHEMFMSDYDRDIESWYENSSRWYLKTNDRSQYCVNQYQILVFLGPLSNRLYGHSASIKANLIISIIGSRGKLINQRFIPRSKRLDSYTLQPFFVILEGSYSLGEILSVGIAWESRSEPDPIKATISFKSSLLDEAQKHQWPEYRSKHAFLSEKSLHDYTRSYRPNQPGLHLKKRSIQVNDDDLIMIDDDAYETNDEQHQLSQGPDCNEGADQSRFCPASSKISSPLSFRIPKIPQIGPDISFEQQQGGGNHPLLDDDYEDRIAIPHSRPQQPELMEDSFHSELPHSLDGFLIPQPPHLEPNINIKLHDIPDKLILDHSLIHGVIESISVKKVVISPIQATYGKTGIRNAKTFCPPHPDYHLHAHQSIKLMPRITGFCH